VNLVIYTHRSRHVLDLRSAHGFLIASYCHSENNASLGLVERVNNKIRVLQRWACGYRDEEYLKLEIVAAFLPSLPKNTDIDPNVSV